MKLIDENIKLKIVDNQKNGSLSKEDLLHFRIFNRNIDKILG
jgi:hypothetical protein